MHSSNGAGGWVVDFNRPGNINVIVTRNIDMHVHTLKPSHVLNKYNTITCLQGCQQCSVDESNAPVAVARSSGSRGMGS